MVNRSFDFYFLYMYDKMKADLGLYGFHAIKPLYKKKGHQIHHVGSKQIIKYFMSEINLNSLQHISNSCN